MVLRLFTRSSEEKPPKPYQPEGKHEVCRTKWLERVRQAYPLFAVSLEEQPECLEQVAICKPHRRIVSAYVSPETRSEVSSELPG